MSAFDSDADCLARSRPPLPVLQRAAYRQQSELRTVPPTSAAAAPRQPAPRRLQARAVPTRRQPVSQSHRPKSKTTKRFQAYAVQIQRSKKESENC